MQGQNRYLYSVMKIVNKGLMILALLSSDIELLYWIRGLKFVLDKRLKDLKNNIQ